MAANALHRARMSESEAKETGDTLFFPAGPQSVYGVSNGILAQ